MKKLLASLGLALGTALCAAPASAGIVLSFNPATTHIEIGETVQVEVRISGLGSEILSAYDLNFKWDSLVAEYTAMDFSSLQANLGSDYWHDVDVAQQGNVGVYGWSTDSDATLAATQANDFVLGTFDVVGVADGGTYFTLGNDGNFERNIVGRYAVTLDVMVGGACISVGSGECVPPPAPGIPEPGSFGLAAAALAGAFGVPALRRRRAQGPAADAAA